MYLDVVKKHPPRPEECPHFHPFICASFTRSLRLKEDETVNKTAPKKMHNESLNGDMLRLGFQELTAWMLLEVRVSLSNWFTYTIASFIGS